MRGMNEEEIVDFVELTRDRKIEVRFIEYMPFDGNKWNDKKMFPYQEMLDVIRQTYPELSRSGDAPNDTSKVRATKSAHPNSEQLHRNIQSLEQI